MRKEAILPWFELLVQRAGQIRRIDYGSGQFGYPSEPALAWVSEAETALFDVFPVSHPLRQRFGVMTQRFHPSQRGEQFDGAVGVFKAALSLVQHDRLGSLIDSVRVESEAELLEQAEALADGDHLAAAAVIAGGALETHLRHLADKHGLTFSAPHGSISAYNQAIATARKSGNEIYSKADQDQVDSWGKLRNNAAHDPGAFRPSKDQVKLMIEGLRQFISRAS